ncbi:MAG TPA: DUF1697 domain-containing protein [Povalibacter sp.]
MPVSQKKSRDSTSRSTCVALLRGINVGKAKRISMADLRALTENLGCSNVRTLLNSGNVVFEAGRLDPRKLAADIDQALQRHHGFSARVVVITATDLLSIIRDNPLLDVATNPSAHLVAFVTESRLLTKLRPLLDADWKPDALALGPRAAYLWCAQGILASKLIEAVARATGNSVTTRNWATVLKLQALIAEPVQG